MSILSRVRFLGRSPLTIVEFIIAFMTIVGGLYVISPVLVIDLDVQHLANLASVITSYVALLILGLVAIGTGLLNIYGIFKRNYRIRSVALFSNIIVRLYALLATILIQGFFPMSWLSPATILAVLVVCYLVVRGMIYRGVTE